MAHSEQLEFFGRVVSLFPNQFAGRVIDIGSFDINGGPHLLIRPNEYVGVDLMSGKNVTLVSGGQDVDLPSNSFDVAMSSECFEHNPYWIATFQNMIRMTKPGGLVVFSTGSVGRERHGTSDSDGGYAAPAAVAIGQEFYRNVSKRNVMNAHEESQFAFTWMGYHPVSADLYFLGIKSSSSSLDVDPHEIELLLSKGHRRAVLSGLSTLVGLSRFLHRWKLGFLITVPGRILRLFTGRGKDQTAP